MNIKDIYKDYITNISSEDMAASLELCLYLEEYCNENNPKKIIDLGSGITSCILRMYKKNHPDVIVFSVDDNKSWLKKTTNFLEKYELSTDNMIHGIEKVNESDFDLIVHDYGNMSTREKSFEKMLSMGNKNTIYIIDDCHKVGYYRFVKQISNEKNMKLFELDETSDNIPTKAPRQRFSIKLTN